MLFFELELVFAFSSILISLTHQEDNILDCSMKPGCQITSCNPVPTGWNEIGFNMEEHLQNKEFPILCKSRDTEKSGNVLATLLPAIYDNMKEINKLKTKVDGLEKSTKQVIKTVVELKQNSQGPQNLKDDKITPTVPMTPNIWDTTFTPHTDGCDLVYQNICYFTDIRPDRDIDFSKALKICEKKNSEVAQILKETYKQMMNILRTKMSDEREYIFVWTNLRINIKTRVLTPENSFTHWSNRKPDTGGSYWGWTNVYLRVDRDRDHPYQGMLNQHPATRTHGTVCQKQI
ncbi:uncharacterized protein LOC120339133 isoform X1 [Styela clava]